MRFFALLLIFILSACTQKNAGSGSSVSVKIPSLSELNAHGAATKVTSLAIDSGDVKWSRACFMVTVNASDIPNRVGSTCDLASGIFAGGVAASGTAQSLEVKDIPMGAGRRFDVYAYFRRSDSELCKSYSSLNEAPKDRVARLGVRENVSLSAPVETVDIDITLPVKMIVAEDRLPVTCDVANAGAGSVGRVLTGAQAAELTPENGYTVRASSGGADTTIKKTSNGFTVIRKRGVSP